jgi:hypothetical protein
LVKHNNSKITAAILTQIALNIASCLQSAVADGERLAALHANPQHLWACCPVLVTTVHLLLAMVTSVLGCRLGEGRGWLWGAVQIAADEMVELQELCWILPKATL